MHDLTIERDWERKVSFYKFPTEHWRHLRTSNVVESPFATLRLRTEAAKRFKKVGNATVVIWEMLLLTEKKFRKLSSRVSTRARFTSTESLRKSSR